MQQQISVVTLGIADLARSRRFYAECFYSDLEGLVGACCSSCSTSMKMPNCSCPSSVAQNAWSERIDAQIVAVSRRVRSVV